MNNIKNSKYLKSKRREQGLKRKKLSFCTIDLAAIVSGYENIDLTLLLELCKKV